MRTIELTRGLVAIIDDTNYAAVSAFKWCAQRIGRRDYAARHFKRPDGTRGYQYLHQFLMPGSKRVDHVDGDGLNNQEENLRAATQQQNAWGFRRKCPGATSKYRGVFWNALLSKWRAGIKVNGRAIHLGLFSDEKIAARAYDVAARRYFGEFASPNFPI